MTEVQEGKREGSVVASQTPESISQDEQLIWKDIQAELEDVGISVPAFEANRAFILEWFKDALRQGAFEEKPLYGKSLPKKTSFETFLEDQADMKADSPHLSPSPDPTLGARLENVEAVQVEDEILLPGVTGFEVKEILSDFGELVTTEITIEDVELRKLIYEVLKSNKQPASQLGWASGHVIMKFPFDPFIHNWEDFKAESVTIGRTELPSFNAQPRHQLRALLERIELIMPRSVSAREQAWDSKRISSNPWTLFKPGSLVVAQPVFGMSQIYRVHRIKLGNGGASSDSIECIRYHYDGTDLVRSFFDFHLYALPNELRINELSFYPIEYHVDETSDSEEGSISSLKPGEDLQAILKKRGKKYRDLCTKKGLNHSYSYNGPMLVEGALGLESDTDISEEVSIVRSSHSP